MDAIGAVGAPGPVLKSTHASTGLVVAPQPPAAPPELVSKFEALMARVEPPRDAASTVPTEIVSKVDDHFTLMTKSLDDVMQFGDGKMSLVDLQALQVRSITQVGIMSMTHTAYLQVLSAGKGSVSSLIKNQ